MTPINLNHNQSPTSRLFRVALVVMILAVVAPFNIFSNTFTSADTDSVTSASHSRRPVIRHPKVATTPSSAFPDSIMLEVPENGTPFLVGDSIYVADNDSTEAIICEGIIPIDTCSTCAEIDPDYIVRDFNPDPTRAAWMSALFPGLGQLYNRRYWKLPIVAGGFMGLLYGYSWNNRMLQDYTQGYRDLMDNDPTTRSYMDFYPPGTDESSLNREWLQRLFKTRKDFYRRNRDLCIVGMVGVYLVAIVDAYVDASLTHFDISPDISLDMAPTLIPDRQAKHPGIGFAWALNF